MADADAADPITASYRVFLNPALPLGRRLLVLQQPNRTDEAAARPPPTQLRVKPASGMVEVDVPLDTGVAYSKPKGLAWGRALHASTTAKSGGSHGLAGGFGFGLAQQRRAPRRRGERGAEEAEEVLEWNSAVRDGKVLGTQTLGGQYPETDEVQHMVGVFQGKDLHLTPVSSLVHLRPQLHHLDAVTQQARTAAATAAAATAPAQSKDAATGNSSGARAIHMTIKTTSDGDAVKTETMADRLCFVQSEPWRKMAFIEEREEVAWDVYNESLFLKAQPAGHTAATTRDASKESAVEDLEKAVPRFKARWSEKRMLEAVSGIIKSESEVKHES